MAMNYRKLWLELIKDLEEEKYIEGVRYPKEVAKEMNQRELKMAREGEDAEINSIENAFPPREKFDTKIHVTEIKKGEFSNG